MSALLSARDLSVGYRGARGRTLMSGVDFDLPRGIFVCLIGPNGSGKSTLLSVLGGLMPPLGGAAMIDGKAVSKMSAAERALAASYVLPESPRPAWISGREIVSLGRYVSTGFLGKASRADDEAVDAAIRAMGAESIAPRHFSELSDGERQKLLMARAIAQGSPLLLMDEPTMFLDAPTRVETMSRLRRIVRAVGRSVVMALHEIDLALDWADELWIADRDGRKLVKGIPEELALNGSISAAYGHDAKAFRVQAGMLNSVSASVNDVLFPRRSDEAIHDAIDLSGEGAAAFWTGRLLRRLGFTVNGDAPIARVEIASSSTGTGTSWSLTAGSGSARRTTARMDMGSLARALEILASSRGT